jgi:hypothetical protein
MTELPDSITSYRPHRLLPGDRIKIAGESNRVRRIVAGIGRPESATSFRTLVYLRPSRGYARYVRSQKASARRLAETH